MNLMNTEAVFTKNINEALIIQYIHSSEFFFSLWNFFLYCIKLRRNVF